MTIKNILATLSALFLLTVNLQAKTYKTDYVITNHSDTALRNKIIVLPVNESAARSVVVYDGKTEITSQLDDLNGDGTPDELIFISDFEPDQRKEFHIEYSDKAPRQRYKSMDIAPLLKNKDIVSQLDSTGAGTLRVWDIITDKSIPIGVATAPRIVANGAIRTIVETLVKEWNYRDNPLDISTRYTLYNGHAELLVEHKITGDIERVKFCSGTTRTTTAKSREMVGEKGIVAVWDDAANSGIGSVIPREYIIEQRDDPQYYLYQLIPNNNGILRYTVTQANNQSNAAAFFEYLRSYTAIYVSDPLKIYEGKIKKVGLPGERIETLIVK